MSFISNMHSNVGSVVEYRRGGQSKSLITNIYSNAGWVIMISDIYDHCNLSPRNNPNELYVVFDSWFKSQITYDRQTNSS